MTPEFIQAITGTDTSEVILPLISISHPDLAEDLHFVADEEPIVSQGVTYDIGAFEITLPEEGDDASPTLTWEIENVSSDILDKLRAVEGFAEFQIKYVMKSTPDIAEVGPLVMELQNIAYDRLKISGTLGIEPVLDMPGCQFKMVPSLFPGMF
ncbi:MAG: hypothetical protein CMM07_25565 [Rhodopirellula sp.]|nr:hypothetical protein [Rhodopirellula sp.]